MAAELIEYLDAAGLFPILEKQKVATEMIRLCKTLGFFEEALRHKPRWEPTATWFENHMSEISDHMLAQRGIYFEFIPLKAITSAWKICRTEEEIREAIKRQRQEQSTRGDRGNKRLGEVKEIFPGLKNIRPTQSVPLLIDYNGKR
jgi:hypothetical protein